MYANRKLVRDHVYKVRLSDIERERLDAVCNGQQPAVVLRELIMRQLEAIPNEKITEGA